VPDSLERDAPGCVYLTSARAAVATPPLQGEARADVAVVGAGYTGLSAALALAGRGRKVVVLEAHEAGWGAAGRNGGQVNPGLKHDPDTVERDLGPVYGPRMVDLAGGAPDYLFDLIERFGIDCEAHRTGTVCAARRVQHKAALASTVAQWQRRGVPVQLWDERQARDATGTDRLVAASFDPRGGAVNPLSLARGLAAAAVAAGARICGDSRAVALQREGSGWRVHAAGGSVRADAVVLGTDGYSDDLWPGLRTSIIPIYSSIVASAPLPPGLDATVLPSGAVVYESGDVTMYYRRDRDGRLLMGGRGRQRNSTRRSDYEHLIRHAVRLWPQTASVRWTHWWSGQFALTRDFYPRFHRPAPGLFIALGYSGRGVALAVAVGAQLAEAAAGAATESLPIPLTPIPHIPFHRLWPIGVTGRIACSRLIERLGVLG
jgi:glycine/D-amino acid oxidase-like deaminating enzyme